MVIGLQVIEPVLQVKEFDVAVASPGKVTVLLVMETIEL